MGLFEGHANYEVAVAKSDGPLISAPALAERFDCAHVVLWAHRIQMKSIAAVASHTCSVPAFSDPTGIP
jgi:hypothetical protein